MFKVVFSSNENFYLTSMKEVCPCVQNRLMALVVVEVEVERWIDVEVVQCVACFPAEYHGCLVTTLWPVLKVSCTVVYSRRMPVWLC